MENGIIVKDENAKVAENLVDNKLSNPIITSVIDNLQKKIGNGLHLPEDYDVEGAVLTAYLSMQTTIDTKKEKPLAEIATTESKIYAIVDMVTSGLDVSKQQCYPILYGNKIVFQKSYFGWQTIARRCGVVRFTKKCIFAGDDFSYEIVDGDYKNIVHKQSFGNVDKDKIIGAYAIAFFADGTSITELMTIDEIRAAWSKNRSGIGKTHKEHTRQMAEKTVISRLCRSIANSYGNKYVFESASMDENFEETMEDAGDIVVEGVKQEIAENANKVEFDDIFETVEADEVEVIE